MAGLSTGPKRILIVDDEKTIADSLAKIFSMAGYDARPVYSAEAARELLREWTPDLAIIDVYLPRMNGIDLAILLKAECPECRLILFSGRTESGSMVEAAAPLGFGFEILAKPVHPTELLDWASAHAG